MPLAGWLVARFGSSRTTRVAIPLWCASVVPIGFAPNLYVLWAVIFVLGAISAVLDVAMNAHGLVVERRYKRPILSSFHAWFSLGGLVGAGTGALAVHAHLTLQSHISLVAAIAATGGLALGFLLLRGAEDVTAEKKKFFVKPPHQLITLGFVAFASMLAEGAIADWSAVYIHEPLHSSQTIAAFGYFGYSLTMVLGRYLGDPLSARFGPVALTRAGGLLGAGSLTVALLVGNPVAAILGFAGAGVGLAAVVPTVFRAAGSRSDVASGVGIASVSAVGYTGFLVGPPLIGTTAHFLGLPAALGIVAMFMTVIGVFAGSAAPAAAPGGSQEPTLGADAQVF